MIDKITSEKRSNNMRAIKSISKLEDLVAKELWKKNIRYRRNVKSLFGKPDIAIKKYKVVIFIDSCFWHGCPVHGIKPKSNDEFWENKLERNKKRDTEVNNFYNTHGWHILRIWEHEIKENLELTVEKIISFINDEKNNM
jgi:DNA mismatch endonuclease (patch repair protein)